MKISCIIPCFNDSPFLPTVLESLKKCPSVDQIICVDDGSEKPISNMLANKFSDVKIVRSRINHGKSASILAGIEYAQTSDVLLIDADLFDIQTHDLERYIQRFLSSKLDMLILSSTQFFFFNRISRHNILFSGVRLLKKSDILELHTEEKPQNYQWEIAINRFERRHDKRVQYGYLQYKSILKAQKVGFWNALVSNIRMLISIYAYHFPEYIIQVPSFCHHKISIKQ